MFFDFFDLILVIIPNDIIQFIHFFNFLIYHPTFKIKDSFIFNLSFIINEDIINRCIFQEKGDPVVKLRQLSISYSELPIYFYALENPKIFQIQYYASVILSKYHFMVSNISASYSCKPIGFYFLSICLLNFYAAHLSIF